jgi:integrase
LLPDLAGKDAGSIRKQDLAAHFADKLNSGSSVELVNRAMRVLKAVLNFALDREMIERNPMTRFRPYEGRGERAVKRGAFEESEIRALLACARPHERALFGLLCFTGLRPGEAFALRWQDMDLEAAVYAHSLQSGMASVAERVTALALGEQPKLRVIDGGQRDVRQPLDDEAATAIESRATA